MVMALDPKKCKRCEKTFMYFQMRNRGTICVDCERASKSNAEIVRLRKNQSLSPTNSFHGRLTYHRRKSLNKKRAA